MSGKYAIFDRIKSNVQMQPLRNIVRFYVEGFRSMTLGRTLWTVILIKLFIMFAVLKIFFFPDFLAGKSSPERSDYVLRELTPDD